QIVDKYDIDPAGAVMVEDIARNLMPAAELGMKTVWVQTGLPWAHSEVDKAQPDFTTDNLSAWLSDVAGH
ncbi:MAG: HAD hydrolase-like protein, partial [Rhodospirillales bacterium]|nr:HAD hydrolase-like protein [Rhodospirillales bacterium]